MKIRALLVALTATVGLTLSTAPAHATGTWVWSNPISHIYQDTSYDCVPAAFVNQLASVGITESQDTLGQAMGTTTAGTNWHPGAVEALQQVVGGTGYEYSVRVINSPAELMAEMEYEIGSFGSAMVAPTVEGLLPWVSDPSNTNGHAIVVYGYNLGQSTSSGGAFYTWDPAPGRGYEWVTAADLFNALQANNGSSTEKAIYEYAEEW